MAFCSPPIAVKTREPRSDSLGSSGGISGLHMHKGRHPQGPESLSTLIRNYDDVFLGHGYAAACRVLGASFARRAMRCRRVKVQWKGVATCS